MPSRARRIVSLLPAATEWVAALGLGDSLVGVSHECDQPHAAVQGRPRVTRSRIDPAASAAEIDRTVRALRERGEDLYELDAALVASLAPDLIVTQAQCDVCAVSEDAVRKLAASLPGSPAVVAFRGSSLEAVAREVEALARAAGVPEAAEDARDVLLGGVERVRANVGRRAFLSGARHAPPRLALLEWLTPPMSAASWLPELVQAAGFECFRPELAGQKSVRVAWEEVARFDPDVLVFAPCGLGLERAHADATALVHEPAVAHALARTSAWANGWIFAAEGNLLFNRPGPRLVESAQVLASIHGAPSGAGAEGFAQLARQVTIPSALPDRRRPAAAAPSALPGTGEPPAPRSPELDAAIAAARVAGAIALRHFGQSAYELKDDRSLVTKADRECEAAVRETLARRTPAIPVLGEETATEEDVRALADRDAWVVDPIDGTSSFAAGLPTFAVSIGLLRRGKPALGVLYLPRTDELYSCDLEGPAFYGARPVRGALTPETVDDRAFFCVPSDAHHDFEIRFPGKMRSLGSTALHVALVARGAALAAVLAPYVWDVAAVGAILARAGGEMIELATGKPIDMAEWARSGGHARALLACAPACLEVLGPLVRDRKRRRR